MSLITRVAFVIALAAAAVAADPIRINFQPAAAAVPTGYLVDSGATFGNRGNGQSYGWSVANTSNVFDRNSADSPDQRFDTLAVIPSGTAKWEIALASGTYEVRIVAGDPTADTPSVYQINAEATLAISGTPKPENRWFENTVRVTVSDGRLSLSNATNSNINKLCFVEIENVTTLTTTTQARIDFQPAASTPQAGYLADKGEVFAARNGLTYGWNLATTGADRGLAIAPDQRYASFLDMQAAANPNAVWDLAVPNGTYRVRAVCGDATAFSSVYRLNAESVSVVSGTPTTRGRFAHGSALVVVTDGKLTLSNGAGASNNKVNFVDVDAVALTAQQTVGPFRWSRKLFNPLISPPSAATIGRDGTVEDAVLVSGNASAGTINLMQWAGAAQSGATSITSGNSLVGPAGSNYRIALTDWDTLTGSDLGGSYVYNARVGHDNALLMGFVESTPAALGNNHGVGFELGGNLGKNQLILTLPFRWIVGGGGGAQWQTNVVTSGNPLGAGLWAVPAGQTLVQAHGNATANKLADLTPLLTELPPDVDQTAFKLQVQGAAWQIVVDIDRDGVDDKVIRSTEATMKASPFTSVNEGSGLVVSCLPALGGLSGTNVGRSPMTLAYTASASVPAVATTDRRPLLVDIPAASRVSPAIIEGKRWSSSYTVTAASGATALTVRLLGARDFFVELPLSAPALGAPITLTQSGSPATTKSGTVGWTISDVANAAPITIRRGDNLLWTYLGSCGIGQPMSIDADGNGTIDFTGTTGQTFPFAYTAAGTFTAKAFVPGQAAPIATASVTVVDILFPAAVACEVGFTRQVPVSTGSNAGTSVNFVAQNTADLTVSVAQVDGSFVLLNVKALRRGTPVIEARNASTNALMASKTVDEFTVENVNGTEGIINNSTSLGGNRFRMRPFLPNIDFTFKMFNRKAGFKGGAHDFTVNTSAATTSLGEPGFTQTFDSATNETIGELVFTLQIAPGETSACFNEEPTQRAQLPIATAQGSFAQVFICGARLGWNADWCKVDVDAITLSECEVKELPIHVREARSTSGRVWNVVTIAGSTGDSPAPKLRQPPEGVTAVDCTIVRTIRGVFVDDKPFRLPPAINPGKYSVKIGDTVFPDRITVTKAVPKVAMFSPGSSGCPGKRVPLELVVTNVGECPAVFDVGGSRPNPDNGNVSLAFSRTATKLLQKNEEDRIAYEVVVAETAVPEVFPLEFEATVAGQVVADPFTSQFEVHRIDAQMQILETVICTGPRPIDVIVTNTGRCPANFRITLAFADPNIYQFPGGAGVGDVRETGVLEPDTSVRVPFGFTLVGQPLAVEVVQGVLDHIDGAGNVVERTDDDAALVIQDCGRIRRIQPPRNSFSGGGGAAGRLRTVDIFGVPLSAAGPTGEGESDRQPNSSFIDMFNLSPSYSVTDVAVPVEGGELVLEQRRTLGLTSEVVPFDLEVRIKTLVLPIDNLLGKCWDANIGSRVIEGVNFGFDVVTVIDDTGNQLQYVRIASMVGGGPNERFVPVVSQSFANDAFKATLERVGGPGGRYVLRHRYGTVVEYEFAGQFAAPDGEADKKKIHRVKRVVDRNGNALVYTYGTGLAGDAGKLLVSRIHEEAHAERDLRFAYTRLFTPTAVPTHPLFGLDTGHRLQSVTDPLGRVTIYTYATLGGREGMLQKVTRPAPATGVAAPEVQFTYDVRPNQPFAIPDVDGATLTLFAPATIRDAREAVTSFTYVRDDYPGVFGTGLGDVDRRLRITSVTTNDGQNGPKTASFGQVSRTLERVVTTSTDTTGTVTRYTFDIQPRQPPEIPIEGNIVLRSQVPVALCLAQITRTTEKRASGASALAAAHTVRFLFARDANGNCDPNGNLTEVIDGNGNRISYAYQSGVANDPADAPINPAGAFDPFINPRRYQAFNLVARRIVDPVSSIKPANVALNLITDYRYDGSFNKLVKEIDAEGTVTRYVLDARGNRTQMIQADARVTRPSSLVETDSLNLTSEFEYELDGFLKATVDPDGRRTEVTRRFDPGTTTAAKLAHRTVTTTVKLVPGDPAQDLVSVSVEDRMGNQRKSIDPRGNETVCEYDDLDRRTRCTYPATDDGRTPATTPLVAATAQWAYDLNGNVIKSLDENGQATLTFYDLLNRPLVVHRRTVADANLTNFTKLATDLVTATTYRANGVVATTRDPKGNVTVFDYDDLLRLIKKTLPAVTDVDNVTVTPFETYVYGPNAGAGTWSVRSGWQATRVINTRGFAADTSYDAAYRPSQVVRRLASGAALAQVRSDAGPLAGEPATVTRYNGVHKPIEVRAVNDFSTTITGESTDPKRIGTLDTLTRTFYDAAHRPTVVALDLDGDGAAPAAGTLANDGFAFVADPQDLVTRSAYDKAGHVTKARDALNRETQTDYDNAGRVIAVRSPQVLDALTNALGTPTTTTFYDKASNPELIVVTRTTAGTGLTQTTRTKSFYDARNRTTQTILDLDGDGVFENNAQDIVTSTFYDLVGNVVAVVDANGNRTETTYDLVNRPITVKAPAIDVTVVQANGTRTTTSQNPLTQTTYDANSNKERVTDAAGTVTFTDYDQWNRPRRVVAAEGTTEAVETTTKYDAGGNALRLTLINKVGATTRPQRTDYEYDAFDRKTKETLPAVADALPRVTRWTYDRLGKALVVTDPKGQRVETTYDRAGRAVVVSLRQAPPFAGTADEERTFVYDAAGNVLSVTTENPRAITRHTCTYVYDALNRVISEAHAFTGQATYTVTSGYDLAGNRTLCTYPVASGSVTGGRRVESIYDLANRLTTITDKGRTGAQATAYTYDLNGNRLSCAVPNGVVSTYTYDALNRNLVATTTRPTTPTATQVYRVAYFYDIVANRVAADEILEGQPNRTLTWTYDRQYRLTGEKAVLPATSTDTTWTYDLAGNRLTQVVVTAPTATTTTTTYAYDDLNQLQSLSAPGFARTYTYDVNGNRTVQTTNGGLTHVSTYDVINRLTQVASKSSPTATSSSVLFTAAYDYRTRRLTTKEGSTTTYFRYDGGDSFQEVRGGTSPAIQVEHMRGSGMGGGIGSILYSDRSKVSGPEETFVYAPNVGHVVALVSSAGAVVKTDRYDAFGNVTASTGTSANNRLANTKERTASMGLDNHGFRYYDPLIGRYTSRDPIGYGDGLNVYVYVHGNPINRVDPLGLAEPSTPPPPPKPKKEGEKTPPPKSTDYGGNAQRAASGGDKAKIVQARLRIHLKDPDGALNEFVRDSSQQDIESYFWSTHESAVFGTNTIDMRTGTINKGGSLEGVIIDKATEIRKYHLKQGGDLANLSIRLEIVGHGNADRIQVGDGQLNITQKTAGSIFCGIGDFGIKEICIDACTRDRSVTALGAQVGHDNARKQLMDVIADVSGARVIGILGPSTPGKSMRLEDRVSWWQTEGTKYQHEPDGASTGRPAAGRYGDDVAP